LAGKAESRKKLGRPRRRWDSNIRPHLEKKVGRVWAGFIWLRAAAGSCENDYELSVP
jgi:hypothetical protein